MKRFLLIYLVFGFLSFCNFTLANTTVFGGGMTVGTVIDKTGSNTIDIPDPYFNSLGKLNIPLTISLLNNHSMVYQTSTKNLRLDFSSLNLSQGTYTLLLEIGDFQHKMLINL